MRTRASRLVAVLATCLVGVLTFSACEQTAPTGTDGDRIRASRHGQGQSQVNHQLARVRHATARYNDLRKATADGYVQFSPHVPGMGIHYLHSSAMGSEGSSALDDELDPLSPEILVYVDQAPRSHQQRLVAVEYAVPKEGDTPPENAVELFSGADAHDWHVHPSAHGLPLPDTWTVHGECHYEGGLGVFLAEEPEEEDDGEDGENFVLWTPPTGAFGSWSGTVAPDQCPDELGGNQLPPLLIAHGKWWTLHSWVWMPNPKGVFHPTNPRVP